MGITAVSPNGTRWYRTLENDTPALSSTAFPSRRYSLFDAPVQLSQSRQTAWRWVVDNSGAFTPLSASPAAATVEAIEFVSPSGLSYALRLDDAGAQSLGLWPSGLQPTWPLRLAGPDGPLYVQDERFPPPAGVGYR